MVDQLEQALLTAEEGRTRRDTLRVPDAATAPSGKPRTSLHPGRRTRTPDGSGRGHGKDKDRDRSKPVEVAADAAPARAHGPAAPRRSRARPGGSRCRAVGRGSAARCRRRAGRRRSPTPRRRRDRRPSRAGDGAQEGAAEADRDRFRRPTRRTTEVDRVLAGQRVLGIASAGLRTMTKVVPDDLDRTDSGALDDDGQAQVEAARADPDRAGATSRQEQLEQALEEHRDTPKSLGRVLIDLGMIKEGDLVRALAEQVGLEFVDLTEYPDRSDRHDPAARGPVRAGTARSRSGSATASSSSRCRTRRTSTRSTTSARSRTATSSRWSPRRTTSSGRSRSSPGMDGQVEALASVAVRRARGRGRAARGGARGRPDRQARERDHDAGGRRPRLRRAHRARPRRTSAIRFRVDGVLHEPMHSRRRTSRAA